MTKSALSFVSTCYYSLNMGIFGNRKQATSVSVELDEKLFKRINRLLGALPGEDVSSKGIAYFRSNKSEKQYLEIVGESFCQEDIKANFKLDKWEYGFLVPDQKNEADPNAVALYLITKDYGIVRVGYLARDTAKKASQKIANLMVNEGLVVPILAIAHSKEGASGHWGIQAYAMTDFIKF